MIYENIMKIMKNKGINASELAIKAQINRSTIENWKKGTQPAADKIQLLCYALECTPNELFGYESIQLTENEKELLQSFRKLSEREQIKQIGVLENVVNNRNA